MYMEKHSQFALLKARRFLPFFVTQFLGAFNDNVFKNALLIIIAYQGATWTHINADILTNICAGLFILPFFIFSAMAGQLADKYEKSYFIRWVKVAEIFIMLLATLGLMLHQLYFLLFVLFMLGTQSTYFGPVKYSILPQQLTASELIGGNGLVEMGTFVAILFGTIMGGILVTNQHHMVLAVTSTILLVSALGFLSSCFIPQSPANAPTLQLNWEPFSQTYRNLSFALQDKIVFSAILSNAWFWFFGAVVLTQIPVYVKAYLRGDAHVTTLLLTVFSLGIGAGSVLCEKISKREVKLLVILLGALGMSLFGVDLYFAHPTASTGTLMGLASFLQLFSSWHVLFAALFLGVFAGIYVVPLFAIIQLRSPVAYRSRIIAANNIMGAFYMVLAAIYAIFLLKIGMTIPQIFLITALLNSVMVIPLVLSFKCGY
ncbi:MAG: MFS transporter [Legionellales bacterium]|nr:MFS transporter [Legionellales bacterium]